MKKIIDEIREISPEYASIPFWSWNDKLEEEELRRQIRDMKSLGMKGFFMHARGGLLTEYMSDEWFDCIDACIDEAEKLGMEAWAYDENGWPSGFAGGVLLKDKKNHAVAIEYRFGAFPEMDEDIISVYIKNEDESFTRVTEDIGAKEYLILYKRYDESYVDTLNPDIADQFIAATHEEYKKRIPADKFGEGKPMPGFFTDEPQYYRWGSTYSNTLPAKFEETYGYSIFDKLPAIFFNFDGADKFRFDYYYLIHKLFIDGFIKKLYEWCVENKVELTGHAVEETTLDYQLMCTGSVMPFYEYETIPGVDYLGRQIEDDLSFKQLGSVCAQLGKKKAISEMFACCGWAVSPTELKKVAEVQYASGVNMMCQHLYPYSERGQRKTDYPLHYSEHNPWSANMREFNDYYTNLGAILSRGVEYAPVLVIHPAHGAFCKYRKSTYSLKEIEDKLFEMSRLLGDNQVPYHYGDEWMMERMAEVKGGKIKVGLCEYEAIIVPFTYSLDTNTVKLLREFMDQGGKIWLYDGVPPYVDGEAAGDKLDFLHSTATREEIFAYRDAVVTENGKNIPGFRKMTRLTDDGRIVYLTSTGEAAHCPVKVSLPAGSWAELDVATLEVKPVAQRATENGVDVYLSFEDGESHVLIERDIATYEHLPIPAFPTEFIPVPEKVRLAEKPENIMTLDMPAYSFDGENYEEPLYIMGVRDMLLRMRHEGKVYLKFNFKAETAPKTLKLVAEPMYERITVNGTPVTPNGDWWFDRSFTVMDVAEQIKAGENEIIVEVNHYQSDYVYYVLYGGVSEALRNCIVFDTEIESMYLVGDFGLRLDGEVTEGERESTLFDGEFTMTALSDTVSSTDAVTDGYPFFGGSMELEFDYDYKDGDATVLKLDGRYATAEVTVGNVTKKIMWKNTIDLSDVLNVGKNTIRVKLTCAMRNTMGPHHYIEDELLIVGRQMWTFENEWDGRECPVYKKRYSFVKFGMKKHEK
ncbi:MAG: hypothetical protein E7628_02095 [Ruminococcaceae bacterium]|nr:hypothetical protein [Oscillospiraceae bacterium]